MIKSHRKLKVNEPSNPAEKTGSLNSLKVPTNAIEGNIENGGDSSWLPPKSLMKPAGQLNLSAKELDEELTRILNGNNPLAPQNIARYNHKDHTYKCVPNADHLLLHYDVEGYLMYKGEENDPTSTQSTEAERSEDLLKNSLTSQKQVKVARNQFNFSDRTSQTQNNPSRDRTTNTEPPPHRNFCHAVNQWSIFDAYKEDLALKEKNAKEKAKPGTLGNKGHRDEDKLSTLPQNEIHMDDYAHNAEVGKALHILERMANQNTYDELAQDFKYWEDVSDEFKEGKGTMLPLWKFLVDKEKKKQVTSLCWNKQSFDIFAVAFGSYDFAKQGPGLLCCFSLKNCSYPEFIFKLSSGVMCLDFSSQHPSLIAAGLYDGTVCVFDLSVKRDAPLFKSNTKLRSPTDTIWQVYWQADDLDENPNFYSISSDGRVTQWMLLKSELIPVDIMRLGMDLHTIALPATDSTTLSSSIDPSHQTTSQTLNTSTSSKMSSDLTHESEKLFALAAGTCFDFHKTLDHIYIVGTEEGKIYKCSKTYNNRYLMIYEGHTMGNYTVRFNAFLPSVFISASADWTVKIWDENESKAVMTFDLGSAVGDVAWAPWSATTFAAGTADGKIFLYDLSFSKAEPICEQQVVYKSKITRLSFSLKDPILIVGDDRGIVTSLKLSPNLRKSTRPAEPADTTQSQRLERIVRPFANEGN